MTQFREEEGLGEGGAADGPLGGKRAGPTGKDNISLLGEKTTLVDFTVDQSREISVERLVRQKVLIYFILF